MVTMVIPNIQGTEQLLIMQTTQDGNRTMTQQSNDKMMLTRTNKSKSGPPTQKVLPGPSIALAYREGAFAIDSIDNGPSKQSPNRQFGNKISPKRNFSIDNFGEIVTLVTKLRLF